MQVCVIVSVCVCIVCGAIIDSSGKVILLLTKGLTEE